MLKVGLTGGIGSGKSTVVNYFRQLHVPIIDADKIAHELIQPGTAIYQKIIRHFGADILANNSQIDRQKLAKLIFSDEQKRLWLEQVMHPEVREQINRTIKSLHAPYCIIDVPLLLETKFPPKIDRILVIDCPKNMQMQRLRQRSHCSINHAKAIIAAQITRKERLLRANDIICNTKSLLELKNMVKKMHEYYLSIF